LKRIILLIFLISVVVSCQKNDDQPDKKITQQNVNFAANQVIPAGEVNSLKDWECSSHEPDYAQVTIDGLDYFPLLYRIDEILYTQNIWLDVPAGGSSTTYIVSKFFLWDDGGSPGGTLEVDDTIVMGAPVDTSVYAAYVSQTVDFNIEVNAFHDLEVAIDVLCYINDTIYKKAP